MTAAGQTYRDNEHRFSFRYPEGWKKIVRPADIPNSLVLVVGQIDGGRAPHVNITAIPTPGVSNEDLLAIPKPAFQNLLESLGLNNVEIKELGSREINGKRWLFCYYQATEPDNMRVEVLHLSFMQNNNEFVILARDWSFDSGYCTGDCQFGL